MMVVFSDPLPESDEEAEERVEAVLEQEQDAEE